MFGGESRGDTIILFFDKEDTKRMENVEKSIEDLLNVKVTSSYNEGSKDWELNITNFKK